MKTCIRAAVLIAWLPFFVAGFVWQMLLHGLWMGEQAFKELQEWL